MSLSTLAMFGTAALLALPTGLPMPTDPPVPDDSGVITNMDDEGVNAEANESDPRPKARGGDRGQNKTNNDREPDSKPDPYEYQLRLACGSGRVSSVDGSDDTNCTYALTACSYQVPPSDEVLYYVWRRLRGSDGPYVLSGQSCGTQDAPAGTAPPPPVPTFGQIQEAFRALPFAKPQVNIQPEGDVTLVNLPTYFEAKWPDAGLSPGEVSEKVQLLSWSVEFKIAPGTYDFKFGDGQRSGATKDLGGPHPEGNIRHTYTQHTKAAEVKVDAELTGWYRVNGGEWESIDTVADLQDEPVVNLEVREAKSRLYNN